MLRTYFIVFCLILSGLTSAFACDACGCSAGGYGWGLMTDYRNSFFRLSYYDLGFRSSAEHGHYSSSDKFTSINVSFRYVFKRVHRLRLLGELPYGRNIRQNELGRSEIEGIGDPTLLLNYTVLNKSLCNDSYSIFLEVGSGAQLPVGEYEPHIDLEKNLPQNFNVGKGTWSYIFQANAAFNYKSSGLIINSQVQWNGDTPQGYHFGNSIRTQLTAYADIPMRDFILTPNLAVFHEHIGVDHYATGNAVPETGGAGTFLSPAINLRRESLLVGLSYSVPIAGEYSGGVIEADKRITMQLSYIF